MHLAPIVQIAGRSLLALLFVLAGVAKIAGPKPFVEHMAEHRLPGVLLPAVIALELGCGLSLLAGFHVRPAALALGLFCGVTAVVFHRDLANRAERTLFVKDFAIAGGLLMVASVSQM